MRKIFSLLAAVLFAGSMMAAEVTTTYVFHSSAWKANVNDVSSDWTSNQNGGGFMNNGVQVTSSSTGASATSPKSFNQISKIVVTYNTNKTAGKGSFNVQIGNNDHVSKECGFVAGTEDGRSANFTTVFNYETPQSGAVKLTVNTTTNSLYVVSVAITHEASEEPVKNRWLRKV